MRRSRIFRRLVFTYLVITLVPFTALTALLLQKSAAEYGRALLTSCQADVEQTISMLELRIQEMNSIAYQMLASENLTRYLMRDARSVACQGIDEMQSFCDSNSFVSLVGMYFGGDDELYSSTGMMSLEAYFDMLGLAPERAGQMRAVLTEGASCQWFDAAKTRVYVAPLPFGSPKPNRVALFGVDHQTIEGLLGSLLSGSGKLVALSDYSGAQLYASAPLSGFDWSALESGSDGLTLNGVRYRVLTPADNTRHSLRLTVLLPEGLLFITPRDMGLALAMDVVLLLVCVLASYCFARESFKPVKQLGMIVGGEGGAQSWDALHSHVQDALRLSESYGEQLMQQRLQLREGCLVRLLYASSESLPLDEMAEQLGGERFLIVCARASDSQGADASGIIAQRLLERIAAQDTGVCTAVEVLQEKAIVLALAAPAEFAREAAEARIRAIFDSARCGEPCFLRVGVGRATQTLAEVRTAYLQALAALRSLYAAPTPPEAYRIIWFEATLPPASTLPDLTEKEIYVKLALEQGDFALASRTLEEIFRVIHSAPMALAHHLCYRLVGYLGPVIREMSTPDAPEKRSDALVAMINASQLDQVRETLVEIARDITHAVREHAVHEEDAMKVRVLACIERHYSDYTLSLDFLSEKFGFSSYYWSRYFKESVGQNFSDYLWAVRLKRAKELLRMSTQVSEVVEQIGYIDVRSFNRKFKNSVGVTPAQYRDGARED